MSVVEQRPARFDHAHHDQRQWPATVGKTPPVNTITQYASDTANNTRHTPHRTRHATRHQQPR
jgi:hypothetical protein